VVIRKAPKNFAAYRFKFFSKITVVREIAGLSAGKFFV
jgi:hypothetical protein